MGYPIPLAAVQVASPCPASWERMAGDDRVRFCGECGLHVYNLGAMTRAEAEALLAEKEGRLCVRFYRRADGTLLTRDCPVGVMTLRRRLVRAVAVVAGSVAGPVASLFVAPAVVGPNRGSAWLRQVEPFATILNWADPQPGWIVMGDVCPPPGPLPPAGGQPAGPP